MQKKGTLLLAALALAGILALAIYGFSVLNRVEREAPALPSSQNASPGQQEGPAPPPSTMAGGGTEPTGDKESEGGRGPADGASGGQNTAPAVQGGNSGGKTTAGATRGGKYTGTISVRVPVASGTKVYAGNGANIDASHTAEGYVMVKHSGSGKRLKVQVTKSGQTYSYDLNRNGSYEVFPLQMGSGSYRVVVYENVTGTKYTPLYSADIAVSLVSATRPFLYPNQKVNFSASSRSVRKSYDLCVGAKNDAQKVEAVYQYIVKNIKYDSAKAGRVLAGKESGYLPDADDTLSSGKGICYDYAALMAVMLRAQDIPTKLVMGSASGTPLHAWNMVYVGGSWKRYDATFAAGGASGGQYSAVKFY